MGAARVGAGLKYCSIGACTASAWPNLWDLHMDRPAACTGVRSQSGRTPPLMSQVQQDGARAWTVEGGRTWLHTYGCIVCLQLSMLWQVVEGHWMVFLNVSVHTPWERAR